MNAYQYLCLPLCIIFQFKEHNTLKCYTSLHYAPSSMVMRKDNYNFIYL